MSARPRRWECSHVVDEILLQIPEFALVALIGPSGSGKSTFGGQHFLPTEVLSSDYFRGLVCDDELKQSASRDAFDALYYVAAKRLKARRLTVIDATNARSEDRKQLIQLAREYHALPVAIVFNLPESVCHARNRKRSDRNFGPQVVRGQSREVRRSIRHLSREGFRHTRILRSEEEANAFRVERVPLWCDKRGERGPFDIIGDVHGCAAELRELTEKLGYRVETTEEGLRAVHPEGRRLVFVGDLVDRGPDSPGVLRFVRDVVRTSQALCVPGNHDVKLLRKLRGREVTVQHGLEKTLEQLEQESPEFSKEMIDFLDGLISHYVLDKGRLVIAHAGLKEEHHCRASSAVRQFALYGETTGEVDEYGFPVRIDWAAEYRGRATVVYGHTPVGEPRWLNRTVNIDTGCAFGGRLTALRYPEKEFLSVDAREEYCVSPRPLLPDAASGSSRSAQQEVDDLLDLEDVVGKRLITTRLYYDVTIRSENAAAALEVMSRFAVDHRWLIHLPPTMSPSETSREPGFLEHPAEAFEYFAKNDVARVVCEEKHMGSRVILVVTRDAKVAAERFGVEDGSAAVAYSRTGRRFFTDDELEACFLETVRTALDRSDLWSRLETNWIVLDCELMPWSAKAQSLLESQYAPVASSSRFSLDALVRLLDAGVGQDPAAVEPSGLAALQAHYADRHQRVLRYGEVYHRYCWPVERLEDWKLAPFHILASEGRVHRDKDHVWHMETLRDLCEAGGELFRATHFRIVDLQSAASREEATAWWLDLIASGGEGMVVKPHDFLARGRSGLVQPAIKCRGREYLRIIYGPEYDRPESLARLRKRSLGRKRSLALREFALGMEALERFVEREPLRRVHECVFAVLALESEPVDPRL